MNDKLLPICPRKENPEPILIADTLPIQVALEVEMASGDSEKIEKAKAKLTALANELLPQLKRRPP